MTLPKAFRDTTFNIAIAILALSTALNCALASRVMSLNARLQPRSTRPVLLPGTAVPRLMGQNEVGNPVTVDYAKPAGGTLVYLFAANCGWCKRNLANIKALTAAIAPSYQVVGVARSPEGLGKYVEDNRPPFPVVAGVSESLQAAYKFGGTPETILVSPQGKVVKVWPGAYMGALQREVEEYFKVKLPGLAPVEAAHNGAPAASASRE